MEAVDAFEHIRRIQLDFTEPDQHAWMLLHESTDLVEVFGSGYQKGHALRGFEPVSELRQELDAAVVMYVGVDQFWRRRLAPAQRAKHQRERQEPGEHFDTISVRASEPPGDAPISVQIVLLFHPIGNPHRYREVWRPRTQMKVIVLMCLTAAAVMGQTQSETLVQIRAELVNAKAEYEARIAALEERVRELEAAGQTYRRAGSACTATGHGATRQNEELWKRVNQLARNAPVPADGRRRSWSLHARISNSTVTSARASA